MIFFFVEMATHMAKEEYKNSIAKRVKKNRLEENLNFHLVTFFSQSLLLHFFPPCLHVCHPLKENTTKSIALTFSGTE